MPYKSEAQRRKFHADPKLRPLARKWDQEYGGKIQKDFNHEAAEAARELIMKMDPDEAAMFVELVVSDVLEETIEKNLSALQGHLDEVVAKRLAVVKRATFSAIQKRNDKSAVDFATALVEVEKALNPYETGAYTFRESDFRRDSSGRFRTKIRTNVGPNTKPMRSETAQAVGIRPPGERGYSGMDPQQRAKYQQEYAQLANFLGTVRQSTKSPGDIDLFLHYTDSTTGEQFTEKVHGTTEAKPEFLRPRDKSVNLTSIEARPTSLTLGGAAFGLTSALGASGPTSERTVRTLNYADQNMGSFADSWTAPTSGRNSNEALYNRVKVGSDLVAGVSTSPQLQTAARFGQFVGSHGAEAERVIGPTARKTAYRYRGTSKPVDLQVARDYNAAVQNAKMRSDLGDRDVGLTQQTAIRLNATRRPSTFEERNAGRAVLVEYLNAPGRRPKKGLYNLQLASGNTPPSEGFIIDADGRIADQAIGYGDDHYLPFNLKRLKNLKGGEYIRTRSVGGPTTEDIYTGLMAGAKQITVISRSGTFTVTFDDSFKGGRRYNDKALRMTKRYAQILDAVQSEQVDRMDINPDIRAAITAKVRDDTKGWGLSGKEISEQVQNKINEFKESPELGDDEYELASYMSRTMQLRADRGEISQRDVDDFKNSVMSDLAAEKEYKFRLNGAGYAAGLEALREQFPYYITVNTNPTREVDRHETERDRGYVEPGRNRPTAASAGLFGAYTGHRYQGQGGKFSAAEANFQGGRRPSSPESPAGKLEATGEKRVDIKNKVEEVRQQVAFGTAAQKVQNLARQALANELDKHPQLDFTPAELQDPSKQAEFVKFTDAFFAKAAQTNFPVPPELKREWAEASGKIGQQVYDPEQHRGIWGAKPYKFDTERREKKLAEVNQRTHSGITSTKKLTEMTDGELQLEHRAAISAKTMLASLEGLNPEDKALMLKDAGVQQGAPGLLQAMKYKDGFDKHLDAVHEVRALRQGTPDAERMPDTTIRPALPTPEDTKGPRNGVEIMITNFQDAAKFYEDNNVPEKANDLRVAAAAMKEELPKVKSKADVEALQDIYREEIAAVVDMYAHKKTKADVDTTGLGGNILS